MSYKFATQDQDYADFASGKVIYNLPGFPAFPVRLASEIFLRARAALAHLPHLNVYDPTCGGAYHLTALGLLHRADIGAIFASDVDSTAVDLARRNLGLLSTAGLDRREDEIRTMLDRYDKESHQEALRSLAVLRGYLHGGPALGTRVFQANVLDPQQIRQELSGETIHLVIADIPYGQLSRWDIPLDVLPSGARSPLYLMLDALLAVLSPETIVAIAADKSQKIAHEKYRRVEHFKVGKRQVALLALAV